MINVRTWSTHTVELGDVLARMNKMLRRARRFLIGATVYGVLECPTFAVCLWVVHLEPHLLDNTGPLTRDTAVCRGASLSEVYPLLCQIGMRHRGLAVCIVFAQRGDVRSFCVIIGTIERNSPAFHVTVRDSRLLALLFYSVLTVSFR